MNLNCLARFLWNGGFTGYCPKANSNKSTLKPKKGVSFGRSQLPLDRGSFGLLDPSPVDLEFIKWSRELINTNPDFF